MELDFFQRITEIYCLGEATFAELLIDGIDDSNFKLTTVKGQYVVKVFSDKKTLTNINDNIRCLIEFNQHKIPVPLLTKNILDDYLAIVIWDDSEKRVCVSEFFDAPSLAKIDIKKQYIRKVVQYLVRIHNLSINITPNYDSWGTANLANEFNLKQKYLQKADFELIKPIVDSFINIPFSNFSKSIIHGDLCRDHVLKLGKQYMILDLGCVDYNYSIIDFAIFNAFFCFEEKKDYHLCRELISVALNEYTKYRYFSELEIKTLSLLIKSAWAAFLIASSFSVYGESCSNPKTIFWMNYSRNLLYQYKEFSI